MRLTNNMSSCTVDERLTYSGSGGINTTLLSYGLPTCRTDLQRRGGVSLSLACPCPVLPAICPCPACHLFMPCLPSALAPPGLSLPYRSDVSHLRRLRTRCGRRPDCRAAGRRGPPPSGAPRRAVAAPSSAGTAAPPPARSPAAAHRTRVTRQPAVNHTVACQVISASPPGSKWPRGPAGVN